jgi:hypothetical protein
VQPEGQQQQRKDEQVVQEPQMARLKELVGRSAGEKSRKVEGELGVEEAGQELGIDLAVRRVAFQMVVHLGRHEEQRAHDQRHEEPSEPFEQKLTGGSPAERVPDGQPGDEKHQGHAP